MVSWGESHKQSGNYPTSVGKGERNVKIDDKIIGERAEKNAGTCMLSGGKMKFPQIVDICILLGD